MTREVDRALHLNKLLRANNISVDEFLQGDYPAVGIHSNSTIVVCNQGLADMFGYSLEELQGMNAWKLFPPESSLVLMDNLMKKSVEAYQVMARHKDGSQFEVELKGNNFELGGEPVRAVLLRRV